MASSRDHSSPQCSCGGFLNSFGWGLAAGIAAAAGALVTRKAVAQASVGQGHSLRHRALDTGAAILQHKRPLDAMSTYLNAFHFYADDMGRQIEAHHFCTHLTPDLHQCVIYDANKPDARLVGIEYIISEKVYRTLPDEERRLWHSHHYEVKSGEMIAPGLPDLAEHAAVADLVSTYGKTWHTWQIDRHDLPLGIPQLMMAFTEDGQMHEAVVRDRDRRFGVSMKQKGQSRTDIPTPSLVPGANPWENGRTVQTRLEEMDLKR